MPRIDPTIQFGHIMQAAIMIGGGLIAWGAHAKSLQTLDDSVRSHEQQIRVLEINNATYSQKLENLSEILMRIEKRLSP